MSLCPQGQQASKPKSVLQMHQRVGRNKQSTEFCPGGGEHRKSGTLSDSLNVFRSHPAVNRRLHLQEVGGGGNWDIH
jgi:hypothetical protein